MDMGIYLQAAPRYHTRPKAKRGIAVPSATKQRNASIQFQPSGQTSSVVEKISYIRDILPPFIHRKIIAIRKSNSCIKQVIHIFGLVDGNP